MSEDLEQTNWRAAGSGGEIPAGDDVTEPRSGMAGPSEPRLISFFARACQVLGLLCLAVFVFTLADLPNRLHIPRSISSVAETTRTQTWYLASLAIAMLALWAGHTSKRATKTRKFRTIGLICAAVPAFILTLMWLPLVSESDGRESARRAQCTNNLKQIQLALLNYENAFGAFPPRVYRDHEGRPLLSWRVLILPYLDQQELFSRFHLDEPWDSPHNRTLIDSMPSFFACPGQATWLRNQTVYQVLDGPGTFLDSSAPTRLAQIRDDNSETIAIGEGANPVLWTSPEDIPFRPTLPFPGWESTHPGGVNFSFVDGSVRFMKRTVWESVLKALATRAGGERISPDDY